MTRQCLELGLIDKVAVNLVPVVMDEGRPFFGKLSLSSTPAQQSKVCIQVDVAGLGGQRACRAYPMRSTSSSSDTAASYKAIGGLPQ